MRRRFDLIAIPATAGIALASVLALAACTDAGPTPTPTAASTDRPTPSSTADPVEVPMPTLAPDLSATENLAYFDYVNAAVVAGNAAANGRSFIDALVAGGFDKAKMQVTSDTTTLGTPADSVQFAVEFQGECLVGQYGPASGGYHGAVRPLLGTGRCLVGQTVPIDW